MRRSVGIGAVKNKSLAAAKFKDKGTTIADDQIGQMCKQMESFRSNLEDFASKHKDDIRKNPTFRTQFQEMCALIGVDPLASSKGFWSEMLGVGDFYYELSLQIVETCMATAHLNGGLIDMEELRRRLQASRGKKAQDITTDDLLRAIKKLKVLGNGFVLVNLDNRYMIQSIPREVNIDDARVLEAAQTTGYVTLSQLMEKLKWERERSQGALDHLVREGLAWVDDAPAERQFWFPSLLSPQF